MIIREVDVHDKENFMVHPGLVDLLKDTEVVALNILYCLTCRDWKYLNTKVIQSSVVAEKRCSSQDLSSNDSNGMTMGCNGCADVSSDTDQPGSKTMGRHGPSGLAEVGCTKYGDLQRLGLQSLFFKLTLSYFQRVVLFG